MGKTVFWAIFLVSGLSCSAENGNIDKAAPGSSGKNGAGSGGGGASGNGGAGETYISPTGGSGGKSAVDGGTSGPQQVTTSTQPVSIDETGKDNPAGLGDADVKKLIAGGDGAGNMRWLYPYDGTVFPRGLLSPLLMWEGGAADAVYLHIKSKLFEYKGCLKPTADGQLQLAQNIWDTACAQTQGPTDPFTLELSVISGGVVTGPIAETVIISGATLKGSVFYNSYSSGLAGAAANGDGTILRIPPGGQAEVFLGGSSCVGCHSVSANGSRMVADTWTIPVLLPPTGGTYAITPTTPVNPPPLFTPAPSASFAGIYPDGSMYLSTANPTGTVDMIGLSAGHNANGVNSLLYETDTGVEIPDTGIPTTAMMSTFSPDGKLLAFNDIAINNGHGIAVMDFDFASRKASNYRVVFTDDTSYPGWPFFLPDNRALIITRGANSQFDGFGIGLGSATTGPTSDIYSVDIKSGTVTLLAEAMGFKTPQDAQSDTTYLPFGAEELHHNYFPTVSPVAAGGYFWLFFDSVRHVGNLGSQRQLWGVAIDVLPTGEFAGSYAEDQSHPAFYLPGQEFGTGNHRAFTALDPCRADGESCTTGIDCCSGFCTDGKCGQPEKRCSQTDEACKTKDDCCNPKDLCIGGFCGQVLLQ